ncbi:MAG: TetR/AcrR family transcriptional regulator [Solirubrobacterales bacterium]|nr:TetR/AcrR family transcriptional regulator [Solirubrobacterales bacterium]
MTKAAALPRKAELRKTRERDLIAVTRRLFDERGMQDAPIEAIAQEAGIARGLIYREFSSKEELFVVTVTDYLVELAHELEDARAQGGAPTEELERVARTYAGFCVRYPAFLDCALSLMKQPAEALQDIVSESRFFRLGQLMVRCVSTVALTLHEGKDAGDFAIDDPDYLANLLWTQALGGMHLVRIGVGVRQSEAGMLEFFPIEPQRVVESCVDVAMTSVGLRPA